MPGYALTDADGYELVDDSGRVVDDGCADGPCCGGGPTPECCDSSGYGGVGPFHQCGARTSPHEACVSELTVTESQDSTSSPGQTTEHRKIEVIFGDLAAYCDWVTQNTIGTTLPLGAIGVCGQCFPSPSQPVFEISLTSSGGATESHGTFSAVLNGANVGVGGTCGTGVLVPVRERSTTRSSRTAQVYETCENNRPRRHVQPSSHEDDGGETERCVAVVVPCFPLSEQLPHDPYTLPPVAVLPAQYRSWHPNPIPLGVSSGTVTDSRDLPGDIYNAVTTFSKEGTVNWSGTANQWHEVWTARSTSHSTISYDRTTFVDRVVNFFHAGQNKSITFRFTTRIVSSLVTTSSFVSTASIRANLGWSFNCDDTPGPHVCGSVPANCEPKNIAYIRGEPCAGRLGPSRPFVLPMNNVLACGLVAYDGWCYTFRTNGPRIFNPVAIGAYIGNDVVTGEDYQDCCECLAVADPGGPCAGVELTQRPAWAVGAQIRDPDTGLITGFSIGDATVSGTCCCSPSDKIKMLWHDDTWVEELFPGYPLAGTTGPGSSDDPSKWKRWQTITSVPVIGTPSGYPPFPATQSIFEGARRDATFAVYQNNFRNYSRDTVGGPIIPGESSEGIFAGTGGVTCEWNGYGEGGFAQIDFDRPLHLGGTVPLFFNLPIPRDLVNLPDGGEGTGWYLVSYSLIANCANLEVTGRWEKYAISDPDRRQRSQIVISRSRFAIVKDPLGQCSGQCAGQPALPTPLEVSGAGGGGGSGGCSGCGGGGGISL